MSVIKKPVDELKSIILKAVENRVNLDFFLKNHKSYLTTISLTEWSELFNTISVNDQESKTILLYFMLHANKFSFGVLTDYIKALDKNINLKTYVINAAGLINSFDSYLTDYFYLFNTYFLSNILLLSEGNKTEIKEICIQSYLKAYNNKENDLTIYFKKQLKNLNPHSNLGFIVKSLQENRSIDFVLDNLCNIELLEKSDDLKNRQNLSNETNQTPLQNETTEMTSQTIINKTQTVIASQVDVHKDAMVQAALLEVGNTVLKTVKETLRPTLPPLAQAFLDNPVADLAIASGTAMVLTLVAPTDEKAKIAATAVLTVGYSNLLGKLQISDIISSTLGKIPDNLIKTVKGSGE